MPVMLATPASFRSDRIIVIGRDMRRLMEKKTGGDVPIHYIPNWIDLAEFRQEAAAIASRSSKENSANKIKFQFFGNMGMVQGIEKLLEGISKVRSDNASFEFIGDGQCAHLVKAFAEEQPEIDLKKRPGVPFNQNIPTLLDCDVALVSLQKGMVGLAVPSKAYFALAANKPILFLGEEGSELELLIRENAGLGWFCNIEDVDSVSTTIDKICESNLEGLTGTPRSVVESKYDYVLVSAQYAQIIREVLSEAV